MKPDDVATAITQALVQGGSQWLTASLVAFLPAMWTMALILHIGRPYVVRTLRRCGLRLGADVWWMSYLLLRDGVLLATFGMSLIFFAPALVANDAFPITGPRFPNSSINVGSRTYQPALVLIARSSLIDARALRRGLGTVS